MFRLVAAELVCQVIADLPLALVAWAPEISVPIVTVKVAPERTIVALNTVGAVT